MKAVLGSRKRRHLTIFAAVVTALAVAAVAAAFYLSTGTTQASAQLGSSPVAVSLSASINPADLYPGKSAAVAITVSNDAGKGNVSAGNVVQDGAVTNLPAGCSAAWFSFAAVPVGQVIAEGASANLNGSLAFQESGTDQSACSGAAPVLHLKLAP